MSLAHFKALYASKTATNTSISKFNTPFYKQPANKYWVQHKLNLLALTKLLQTASFEDRFTIPKLMQVAEGKVTYWERHPNFKLKDALIVYKAAKKVEISQ